MTIQKPSGSGSTTVTPSSINGNVRINGMETPVYNDAAIRALISGGGSNVTASSINGNIKINGVETPIYNDAAIRTLIGGSAYISGKKINCLGDSFTKGLTGITPWPTVLQNNYGCTTRNYGVVGGTTIDNGTQFGMVVRYPSMDPDADINILWGGWNDLHQNRPIGTFGDGLATTFYGALDIILNGLQGKYVGKKLFICTILDSFHPWATVKLWNQAIRDVSEYRSVPIIETARIGFNGRNATVLDNLYYKDTNGVADNIHPNNPGNVIVADVIAKAINSH